jgi:Phosphoglycerol transferase and related proteins, alkaline phosphatase superfamily
VKNRLWYLVKTYLLTILLFVVAKVAFMLLNHEGHSLTATDMMEVIWNGLSLDLSTALYFIIVPFLLTVISLWVTVPKWVYHTYYALIAVAFALAFVADTSLYPFWGFKLDASCLSYLETPTEAMASVTTGYLVWRVILVTLLALLIYFLYGRLRLPKPASQHRFVLSLLALLCIPLLVIGIRGGFGESTTNIGQVYYSQNQFLNHSAVNPVFSFLYSLSHTMGDVDQYQFMNDDESTVLTEHVYTTESIQTDTLLNTRRPNVIIILLESAGEQFASAMPYLQRLKKEGICFANCYANSWRTDRGTLCTLSGYPSFPSLSVMKMPEKSRTLPSIASSLQQVGYETSYLYGGDINFTNMRSYLVSTGWEQLVSMDDFTALERRSAKWGVRDDITFERLSDMIQKAQAPFLIGYSTLSSHEPWDVPIKQHPDEKQNAFAYLDHCLRNFIEPLKKTAVWQDMLIIMLADHGINNGDIDQSKPLQKNHIPMLWVGGAVKEPRCIEALCNQSDLAATLLGQMQLSHETFTFSRDVLSKSYQYPTAVHNYNNAQLLIDSTGYILYDIDAKRLTINESADSVRLQRLNQAILQRTINDLKNR